MSAEVWRAIPSHEGYEASDHGRVRSVDRIVECKNGQLQRWQGQLLRPAAGRRHGRLSVDIKGRSYRVGVLVLEAFVGPRPDGMECCHRDDVQSNNHLANLRWDTSRENKLDIVRNGNHELANRDRCPRRHLLVEPNLAAGSLKSGRRGCKACHRARARMQKLRGQGLTGDLKAVSDGYYAEIMAKVEAA